MQIKEKTDLPDLRFGKMLSYNKIIDLLYFHLFFYIISKIKFELRNFNYLFFKKILNQNLFRNKCKKLH